MKAKERANATSKKVDQHSQGGSVWATLLGETVSAAGVQAADWSEVDRELLVWLVQTISKHDGAVLLGTSKDKTQYHIKLYGGGKDKNFWFAGHEGGLALMHEWISAICMGFEAVE